jgi:hypothetical protein
LLEKRVSLGLHSCVTFINNLLASTSATGIRLSRDRWADPVLQISLRCGCCADLYINRRYWPFSRHSIPLCQACSTFDRGIREDAGAEIEVRDYPRLNGQKHPETKLMPSFRHKWRENPLSTVMCRIVAICHVCNRTKSRLILNGSTKLRYIHFLNELTVRPWLPQPIPMRAIVGLGRAP